MKELIYKGYKGFVDLREFDLPVKVFNKLAEIQYHLSYMAENPDYYRKFLPGQWQKAQELSGLLQIELQKYNLIKKQKLNQ